jgi:hypothetical protein
VTSATAVPIRLLRKSFEVFVSAQKQWLSQIYCVVCEDSVLKINASCQKKACKGHRGKVRYGSKWSVSGQGRRSLHLGL